VKMTAGLFSVAFAVLVAVGCASTAPAVQTNKDAESLRPIKVAYVVVNMNDVQTMFKKTGNGDVGTFLADRLEQGLNGKAVTAKAVHLGGLELGSDVRKDAQDFGADTVVTVDLANGVVAAGKVLNGGTLVVSIGDIASGMTIWKGKITVYGKGWGVTESMLSDCVDQVLDAMARDGLF
jgi:hypothetical protein